MGLTNSWYQNFIMVKKFGKRPYLYTKGDGKEKPLICGYGSRTWKPINEKELLALNMVECYLWHSSPLILCYLRLFVLHEIGENIKQILPCNIVDSSQKKYFVRP